MGEANGWRREWQIARRKAYLVLKAQLGFKKIPCLLFYLFAFLVAEFFFPPSSAKEEM
jgi:hypothetical protein